MRYQLLDHYHMSITNTMNLFKAMDTWMLHEIVVHMHMWSHVVANTTSCTNGKIFLLIISRSPGNSSLQFFEIGA